jgi:hypothetical protein
MGSAFPPAFRGKPFRPSAAAWNAIGQAVDPAKRAAVVGGPAPVSSLAAIHGYVDCSRLEQVTGKPVVFGQAVPLAKTGLYGSTLVAASPIDDDPADDETRVLTAVGPSAGTQHGAANIDLSVAVCVDPQRKVFAVSGFAAVRLRVLSVHHRFARLPVQQPEDTTETFAKVRGFFDSAAWGPASICGLLSFAVTGRPPTVVDIPSTWSTLSGMPPAADPGGWRLVWAVVRL